MTEKKSKPRGLAGMIAKDLEPLNSKEAFKEQYKDADFKLLLNATDGKYAALIIVKNGTVEVEGLKNDNKDNLKREVLGWNGKMETTLDLFFKMFKGELKTGKMLLKMITGKLKSKGNKYLMELDKMYKLLA